MNRFLGTMSRVGTVLALTLLLLTVTLEEIADAKQRWHGPTGDRTKKSFAAGCDNVDGILIEGGNKSTCDFGNGDWTTCDWGKKKCYGEDDGIPPARTGAGGPGRTRRPGTAPAQTR